MSAQLMNKTRIEQTTNNDRIISTADYDDGEGPSIQHVPKAFRKLPVMPGRLNTDGKNIRSQLQDYFMKDGAVDWQWHAIGH